MATKKPAEKGIKKKPEKGVDEKDSKEEKKSYNPWKVLKYPHLAEKSIGMVEMENKLVFVVDRRSSRKEIKEAIEKGFNVKVDKINIEITRDGHKKAYAKLGSGYSASDIASRLGMI